MRVPRRSIILAFIGFWALAVLCTAIWLNLVWDDCKRNGDLQAECFAPVGALAYQALAIMIGLSGITLWIVAARKNSDKDG